MRSPISFFCFHHSAIVQVFSVEYHQRTGLPTVFLGKSVDWVKKWLKRFREADFSDVSVLHSHSRARKTSPASIADQPLVVQRILEIRDAPPENLQRIPGPEAILYYLHRDPLLQSAGMRLPRSQAPVWKILRAHGRIALDRRRKRRPQDLKDPGEEVQLDLKDAVTVPADPQGKLQHVKPHDFRRFVGTELAAKDIRVAQNALGHKSIEITAKHYVLDHLEGGATEGLY